MCDDFISDREARVPLKSGGVFCGIAVGNTVLICRTDQDGSWDVRSHNSFVLKSGITHRSRYFTPW